MQSPSYLVHLIGFAGSGKLSIAKYLAPQLSALLVDNHHVNNVILGLIEPDGVTPLAAGVWDNIRQVRAAVLDTVLHHAKPGRSFVFTNELFEGDPRAEQACQHLASIAQARGALYRPVCLEISAQELALRVMTPGRAAQFKEMDTQAALLKASTRRVYRPLDHKVLDLAVTHLTAEQAADQIALMLRAMV